jgi:uncharacterized membrane protein YdcZ (DUF606 family)
MQNETQILELVTSVILGVVLPFVTEAINNKFSLHREKALAVVSVLSGVVALAVLYLTGQVTANDFTLASFTKTFLLVFGAGQVVFNYAKVRVFPETPPTP